MSQLRCLVCGSSQLDPEGYKCGQCGSAVGLRSERCYVSEETKEKLLHHARDLSKFGVELEQSESLEKVSGQAFAVVALVLQIVESVRPATLRDLILFLRKIALPEEEILRLRLDEPDQVLTYFRMDKEDKK
jgi:hypothetical protein